VAKSPSKKRKRVATRQSGKRGVEPEAEAVSKPDENTSPPAARPVAEIQREIFDANQAALDEMYAKENRFQPTKETLQLVGFDKIRHRKKRGFLLAYCVRGTVTRAAADARVDRTLHYVWLEKDTAYAAAFADARQVARDLAEDEIWRRASEGQIVPVFHQGLVVGYRRERDSTLLIFHAKGNDPDKWADRAKVTHDGQLTLPFPDVGTEPEDVGRARVTALGRGT